MKTIIPIALLFILLNLGGCSSFSDSRDPTESWTAQQLFDEAHQALKEENYPTAVQYYEYLEARFPFGPLAQQGQIDIIYAYYKLNEPESALAAADRFVRLYPGHANLDYVYYLRGLVNFNLNSGIFDRFLSLDKSQREQAAAFQSFQDFSELLNRFPDSHYAEDARQRMLYLRNTIADYELNVAHFYMVRGAYIAALNRAQKVVEAYQRTPAIPEALALMARAYKVLGMNDLFAQTLDVLRLNYPNHPAIEMITRIEVRG